MSKSVKKVLIFTALAIFLAIVIWPTFDYKITSIIDGNTIVLNNGAEIKLIGITSTEEAKQELSGFIGSVIDLQPDNSSFFDKERLNESSVVYAYVLLPEYDYLCINSSLLKQGKANLEENCTDSLANYRRYAGMNAAVVNKLTPTPVEPIDYAGNDIKLPQYVSPGERKYSAWYVDGNKNLLMLEEACDFNLPYTKTFANELAGRAEGDYQSKGINQVCEIFDYCYTKWKYVSDPAEQEYVARASETISASLVGDCDDFAVLLASCVLSIGGNARITTADNASSGHAYAELDITDMDIIHVEDVIRDRFSERSIDKIHTKSEGGRVWLNLDWQAGYPGGPYWDYTSRSVYSRQNNEWKWDGNLN